MMPIEQLRRRVLLLYKELIPSVRLCGHYQLMELAERGTIEYRNCTVKNVTHHDLNWADIVILSRLDSVYERELAQLLRKAGKYIIYVMDDDLLNVPAELSSSAYYARKEIRNNISRMITMSDALISPSPVLLAKYATDDKKGILLEEPAIAPVSYIPHAPEKPVQIGFAGSTDRVGDIEAILHEALCRIKTEYSQKVEFVFFGAIPAFAAELGAQCIPYRDSYDAYRETMNALQLDIGLAPMPDTEFHACKHYNKFIEYAAANTVGIFSAVRPYDRLEKLFGWKLLCTNTADSWYAMIKQLLDCPEKLDALKQQIATLVASQLSIDAVANSLQQEIMDLPENPHQKSICSIKLCIIRIEALFKRLCGGLKRYGMRSPAILIRLLLERNKREHECL